MLLILAWIVVVGAIETVVSFACPNLGTNAQTALSFVYLVAIIVGVLLIGIRYKRLATVKKGLAEPATPTNKSGTAGQTN